MSPADISLLKKLAVLKSVLKTNKYFCHYSCGGAQVPELRVVACLCRPALFPCPRWVAGLCTSLRATVSRFVHKAHHARESYVLFQFGCQAQTPNYPLPVFSKLEKISLFHTSFLVNFFRLQHQQTRKWSLRSPIILICRHSLYANCIM